MLCSSSSSYILLFSFSHLLLFFFNDPATTEIYTLSLHDALPISGREIIPIGGLNYFRARFYNPTLGRFNSVDPRSEEHTSELQSLTNLVCRLLLEKKKKKKKQKQINKKTMKETKVTYTKSIDTHN